MHIRDSTRGERRVFLVDSRGAVPEYVGLLARALDQADVRVTVVTSKETLHRVLAVVEGSAVRTIAPFGLRRSGGARNAIPYLVGLVRLVLAAVAARPAVLHFQWWVRPGIESRLATPLARLIGAAAVYTVHNVVPHETKELSPVLQRAYLAMDALVVHTERSRVDLISRCAKLGAKPIVVSPHGNYLPIAQGLATSRADARNRLGLDERRFIVGFVGSVRPYKGVTELVASFELVRHELRDACLVIAGRPDDWAYAARVSAAIARLPVERVRCDLRHLETDEFVAYLAALDLLVLPYREIDQSGVLLFAMSLGIPLVLTALASFVETVRPTEAAFVPPDDTAALAAAILALARDEGRRASLGRNAADAASARFGWGRAAEIHRHLYSALAA